MRLLFPSPKVRLIACAWLAALSACTCGDAALSVTVEIAPSATTTRCVKVAVQPTGGQEVSTAPVPRTPGKDTVTVAVYQGALPVNVSVLARGYEDPSCTQLNEESAPGTALFSRGQVTPVTLRLDGSPCVRAGAGAGTPCPGGVCRSDQACVDGGTEFDCVNGVDDDFDGRIDCLDEDCLSVLCASADQCLLAPTCQADGGCDGPPVSCETPPSFCFLPVGTCGSSTGTCSYTGDTVKVCDDSNACTDPDHCLEDGGCGGPQASCSTPPSQCYGASTGCDPVLGCQYPVNADGGCDDGNACTFDDRCDEDAGCAGTPYTCPDTECASNTCLGDGGCTVSVPRTGQPCTGGVCSSAGRCSVFSYTPSNFDPLAIAAGGISPDLSITCNAWFNSTDGGQNWCGQPAPVATVTGQDAGPDVVVLAMSGLNVASGGSVTLVGSRPVIFAVYGDATVAGTISARSLRGMDAGAGFEPTGLCNAGDGPVANGIVGSGGGGGGYGLAGGSGGNLTGGSGVSGGAGGGGTGNTEIIPLRGGCSGGEGGRPNDTGRTGGRGGMGGGAVQLSAAGLLNLVGTGTVTASGAGGQGGRDDQAFSTSEGGNGGGGGGSGGSVLLEGEDVLIPSSARLTANGGGGGEGGDGNSLGNTGASGGDGPAGGSAGGSAGAGSVACGGDGAAGGSASGGAGDGGSVTYVNNGCAAGGGGGAVGRIRVNGYGNCQVDAGVQSPPASFGGTCP